ncbi:hypothetical protein Tco_0968775 [Tanacetum coccineum]
MVSSLIGEMFVALFQLELSESCRMKHFDDLVECMAFQVSIVSCLDQMYGIVQAEVLEWRLSFSERSSGSVSVIEGIDQGVSRCQRENSLLKQLSLRNLGPRCFVTDSLDEWIRTEEVRGGAWANCSSGCAESPDAPDDGSRRRGSVV